MVTLVGTQDSFGDALAALLELEYDALEAYEAAIARISDKYKKDLINFMNEHRRHIDDLTRILTAHQQQVPTGPSVGKQWLTKGKVVLASLVGDQAILSAMESNEEDTNTAYERMVERRDKWDDASLILNLGLADEKKHKAWLKQAHSHPFP